MSCATRHSPLRTFSPARPLRPRQRPQAAPPWTGPTPASGQLRILFFFPPRPPPPIPPARPSPTPLPTAPEAVRRADPRATAETTLKQVEDAFKEFTSRKDIAVLLITQAVASMIRQAVDSYSKPIPAILEIPSKDQPYDPNQDSILSRVKFLFQGSG